MNIKILDSWLREHLKTKATPQKIAEIMSLTSVGIEKIEKYNDDWVYDVEVTTNRPDLMSVIGLAREAAVTLPQHGVSATFEEKEPSLPKTTTKSKFISFENDPKLVRRLCAVVMDVTLADSTNTIKDRVESSGIRSLNNVIDITNYVMRLTGHPTHVFDYDRLTAKTKNLIIRESKKGEKMTTLDGKTYTLPGGDIIADDGHGEIIDLLGIMGTANSVVTDSTKRIMFFLDNLEPHHIRKTSMALGIRTEAAVLNEKDIDASLTAKAFAYGIALFEQFAAGKIVSEVIDIHYESPVTRTVQLEYSKLKEVVGVDIAAEAAKMILEKLGFGVTFNGKRFNVEVPSIRKDIQIPEDLIEEVARIYGYHNIPTALAPIGPNHIAHYANEFYWENKVKQAFKYWGFNEIYTYALVSENLFEGELSEAVTLSNPLNEDMLYMRKTLVPSLLQVLAENKTRENIQIFELANVYYKRTKNLPDERLMLAGIVKKTKVSFFEVKGLFEQLAYDLGIQEILFKPVEEGSAGAEMYIGKDKLGDIEILDEQTIDFEADFATLLKHATLHKVYIPLPKYPAIIEDMTFVMPANVAFADVMQMIKQQSKLIKDAVLIDSYQDNRTFRITYQHPEKNLTADDVAPIREKIAKTLREKLHVGQK